MHLLGQDDLSKSIVESGVVSWEGLIRVVKRFPYGRNQHRDKIELVWTERKGTCSSKHAFLKLVADLNNVPDIHLVLCIYKMTGLNTPGVNDVLSNYGLEYLPEAHCFLLTPNGPLDVTAFDSDFDLVKNDVLHEEVIGPAQIVTYKVQMHKKYMMDWAKEFSSLSGDEVWRIREECLQSLEE